jgi:hypothetical protein
MTNENAGHSFIYTFTRDEMTLALYDSVDANTGRESSGDRIFELEYKAVDVHPTI